MACPIPPGSVSRVFWKAGPPKLSPLREVPGSEITQEAPILNIPWVLLLSPALQRVRATEEPLEVIRQAADVTHSVVRTVIIFRLVMGISCSDDDNNNDNSLVS